MPLLRSRPRGHWALGQSVPECWARVGGGMEQLCRPERGVGAAGGLAESPGSGSSGPRPGPSSLPVGDTAPWLLRRSVRDKDGVCATLCCEGAQRAVLGCEHAGPHPAKAWRAEGPDLGVQAGLHAAAVDVQLSWQKSASALDIGGQWFWGRDAQSPSLVRLPAASGQMSVEPEGLKMISSESQVIPHPQLVPRWSG